MAEGQVTVSNEKKRTGLDLMHDACAALAIAPADVLTAEVNGRSVAELLGEMRTYLLAVNPTGSTPYVRTDRPEARL